MKRVKLGEITFSLESGGRPKGGAVSNGVFSLGAEHLNNVGGFDLSNGKYIPLAFYKKLTKGILVENDILIVKDGATTGKTSFVDDSFPYEDAAINEHVFKLVVDRGKIFPKYCFYYLFSDQGKNQILSDFRGATVGGISKDILNKVEIPLPNLATQQRIAAILDRADEVRQYNQALIEKYDALTQSLFLEMFGDPVKNEKGWEKKCLFEACYEIVDCPHSTPVKCSFETNYPCIRTSEIKNGEIAWNNMQYLSFEEYEIRTKRLKPQGGDIVYSREGSYGDAVLLPEGSHFSLGQRTMLFRPNNSVNPLFLHRMVISDYVYFQAKRKNSGSTVGHVNVKDIKNFEILIPPLALQNQFAERVQIIEQQKEQARQALAKSEELFQRLLQDSFKD